MEETVLEMGAWIVSQESTCTRRKVGAIIAGPNGILGKGFNDGPGDQRCGNGDCPRADSDVEPYTEYSNCIAIHAEARAITDAMRTVGGPIPPWSTLYVTDLPCPDCIRLIKLHDGIRRVVVKFW